MRIVAGRLRGRALTAPKDHAIRPTSDRVRETIFNVLAHGLNDADVDVEGAQVLDLFAGTGALGLEALSHGAAFCLFVETSVAARAIIRRNIEAFELTGCTRIHRRDATALGEAGTRIPADLVFLDPPYAQGLGERALRAAASGGWLADGAVTVWEEAARATLDVPAGFTVLSDRVIGDTRVVFARYAAAVA
ncbi:MAG: 16S rRNA (guanine(966)-N(2))-methyltransferase RsmD [Pseudomonadota bacterium]